MRAVCEGCERRLSRTKESGDLDERQLDNLRKVLQKEKERLSRELEVLIEENRVAAEETQSSDDNYEDDIADAASAIFERERDLSLQRNLADILAQVDGALQRLDAGKYGVCARCGRPIEKQRLKALPYAELCIECKKKEEQRVR